MKSVCAFIHYGKSNSIPLFVNVFVNELAGYFDEVVLIYNERKLNIENRVFKPNIRFFPLSNDGYDFGKFYKFFKTIDPNSYSQIAVVNDSNLLFNRLEKIINWANTCNPDFWGLIESDEKPWFSTHSKNWHLQSHFLVFNESSIPALLDFMDSIDIQPILEEKNPKLLRRKVINTWEIGISWYLTNWGLKGKSYIGSDDFRFIGNKKVKNHAHYSYKELIENGFPLLKLKIAREKSFLGYFGVKQEWERLVLKLGNPDWDLNKLILEAKTSNL
jgi:hypothetical protein